MARPCKAAVVLSEYSQTSEEINSRIEQEEKLKGNSDNIEAPRYLNENQVFLFNYIRTQLKESGLLGNLDIYILSKCAIAIERLQLIDEKVNEKPILMYRKEVMSARKSYTDDFFRCCNELSLSPQSRAKLSNINLQAKATEEDPLLKVLRGEL